MDYLTMDESVCPVCGKVFHTVVGREWGWTYKGSKYCTYHCMRHVEIRHRVAMGWQNNPLVGDALSPKAAEVAKQLVKLRALRKAYVEMALAEGREDEAYLSMANRVGQLAERELDKWEDRFARLEEGKRRIAVAVFVEARPLEKVAAEMDIDVDLLETKLRLIYEALARMDV